MSYLSRSLILFVVVMFVTALVPIFGCPRPGDGQSNLESRVVALEAALATTQANLAAAQAKLEHVSVEQGMINGLKGPHLIITGCNVHIRSGSGDTTDGTVDLVAATAIPDTTPLGLGNLIIGYNEATTFGASTNRAGSHNLIVGPGHNYPNVGGVVFGQENDATGPLASVTGGFANEAQGYASSISGGSSSSATEIVSSVSGGQSNKASGIASSISGGARNTASSSNSSVAGGSFNEASGENSSVSGGNTRTAAGTDDWVAGTFFQDN